MSLERLQSLKRQGGWLMPMAVFIIVVMALFAATMNRIGSQSAISVVQEQLSLQAFYAAESGAQLALNQLLYPLINRVQAEQVCTNIHSSMTQFPAPGMQGCRVTLACTHPTDSSAPGVITIVSRGICAQGGLMAQRSLEVAVKVDE